jgi:hypothetical protein
MNALARLGAQPAGIRLLLGRLHMQDRLDPIVREALACHVVLEHARQAGLSVSADELQTAANAYRRSRGLYSTDLTLAWLAAGGLSVEDFETLIEAPLLATKLRKHQVGARVDEQIANHPEEFESVDVDVVVVGSDELAREIASQVREEGRDFPTVVQEHELELHRHQLPRRGLPESVAAAAVGDLAGPQSTPQGFILMHIRGRRQPELDAALRERVERDLFDSWLGARIQEAIAGNTGSSA